MAALPASGDSWDYWWNDTSTRSGMMMLGLPSGAAADVAGEAVDVVAAVLGRLLAEVGLDGTPAES